MSANMHHLASRTSRPSNEGHIYRRTQDYALASWRNVLMVVWRKHTNRAAVVETRSWCDRLAAPWTDGVFLVTVIQQGAAPPDPEARRMLASYLKSCEYIRGSAVTIEGKGFRSALVRGVVTSLSMLAEQPYPHQVCSLSKAVDMFASIARKRALRFDANEARRAIFNLRARIDRDDEPELPLQARVAGR